MRFTIIKKLKNKKYNTKYHHRARSLKKLQKISSILINTVNEYSQPNVNVNDISVLSEIIEDMQIIDEESNNDNNSDEEISTNQFVFFNNDTHELFIQNKEIISEVATEEM